MRLRIAAVLALLVAVTAGLVAFAGGAGAAPKAVASPKLVAPLKVTVTMTDFKFKLSKLTVPKGKPVVFTVINKGPSPHDFDVSGTKGTPIIAAGKRVTQKVTFKKAGKFRYVCTVPRHAQFGMAGNLTVK
jgi:uncharacterized cupredoxin-like copper-binding protein